MWTDDQKANTQKHTGLTGQCHITITLEGHVDMVRQQSQFPRAKFAREPKQHFQINSQEHWLQTHTADTLHRHLLHKAAIPHGLHWNRNTLTLTGLLSLDGTTTDCQQGPSIWRSLCVYHNCSSNLHNSLTGRVLALIMIYIATSCQPGPLIVTYMATPCQPGPLIVTYMATPCQPGPLIVTYMATPCQPGPLIVTNMATPCQPGPLIVTYMATPCQPGPLIVTYMATPCRPGPLMVTYIAAPWKLGPLMITYIAASCHHDALMVAYIVVPCQSVP